MNAENSEAYSVSNACVAAREKGVLSRWASRRARRDSSFDSVSTSISLMEEGARKDSGRKVEMSKGERERKKETKRREAHRESPIRGI